MQPEAVGLDTVHRFMFFVKMCLRNFKINLAKFAIPSNLNQYFVSNVLSSNMLNLIIHKLLTLF